MGILASYDKSLCALRALDFQKCEQGRGETKIQDFSVAIAERENRRIT